MTICFLIKGNGSSKCVCLGEKKRGFRVGKLNGFGGKLEVGETLGDCALRETREESGVVPKSIEKCAVVYFYDPGLTHECHVYIITDWEGEPVETEEMLPAWYPVDCIPFDRMGEADPLWIPPVLHGQKVVANFYYDSKDIMHKTEITFVDSL